MPRRIRLSPSSDLSSFKELRKRYDSIREPKTICMLKIQDVLLSSVRTYLRRRGFAEILPPIIGPVTDPGIRGAKQASINYYGSRFKVMSSMILYKQMAIQSLAKVFAVSPNIRLEPTASRRTGRHLAEFRQVDIEASGWRYTDAMELAEGLIGYVCQDVHKKCAAQLSHLKRNLKMPRKPFKRLRYPDVVEYLRERDLEVPDGEEIPWSLEEYLSAQFSEPFFITDYPITARGFYDREDPNRPGTLLDFDLYYPEGYGEAASGAEREHTYRRVLDRMKRNGENARRYRWYLRMLRRGVPLSAGFGIGVERLTRWVCGLGAIWEAVPFPKVPGVESP